MKLEIELTSELRYFVVKTEGQEFRSGDTSAESLHKLWSEILDAKVFNEDEEKDDRWFDEEYCPEWPESAARIMQMVNMQLSDGWEFNQDY